MLFRMSIALSRVLRPTPLPVDEDAERVLKWSTLANLYNECPACLANLHQAFDDALFAAYG